MPELESVSVTADVAFDEGGGNAVLLKLQGASYELNVWISIEEVPNLRELSTWENGSTQIGRSAGAPCFWSNDDKRFSVLVGQDNQTWDFAVWFSIDAFRKIVEEAERISQAAV